MSGDNGYNYVESFRTQLEQKYSRELTSAALTTDRAIFMGAKTVKIPRLDLGGYKDHARTGGWNRQVLANDFELKVLEHDRNVEFYVDAMDVDETNQILSAANITNVFVTEQAIPEMDKYRYSKIYAEYTELSKSPDTTRPDLDNVLEIFDAMMKQMDEAEVPLEGRRLYVTPTIQELLKQAKDLNRTFMVQGSGGTINRAVRSLDDVEMVMVPSSRMKTAYNFTSGALPAVGARQINMILLHPRSVIAPIKHTAIYLWPPGSHTTGDGYLYQNRSYTDLFLIERKADGIMINVGTEGMLKKLTFVCVAGDNTGETKIASGGVDPAATGTNTYVYKINGMLPYLGEVMTNKGWTAYGLGDALSVAAGNDIALVEIDSASKAVAGGIAAAVPKAGS